jgi:hypothetical protein
MKITITVPLPATPGFDGLNILDISDGDGPHKWLAHQLVLNNAEGVAVNPATVGLVLSLFRKSGTAWVQGPTSDIEVRTNGGDPGAELYRRLATAVEDGVPLDLQNYPMQDVHVAEQYRYVVGPAPGTDAVPVVIDFTRVNSGVQTAALSTEPPPIITVPPPLGPARVRQKLEWVVQ